jgi:hypothetical protein
MMKVVIIVELIAIISAIKAVLTNLFAIGAADNGVGTAADVAGVPIRAARVAETTVRRDTGDVDDL